MASPSAHSRSARSASPGRDRGRRIASLVCVGVSFREAPLTLRDQLSFPREDAVATLRAAAAAIPGLEATILSTCYRTECYLVSSEPDVAERFLAVLETRRPGAVTALRRAAFRLTGRAAVLHLARVAAGLESAVLGDVQVHSQVRTALQIAESAGTLGAELHQAFTTALQASRRARAETTIASGSPSVGSAIAALVRRHLAQPRQRMKRRPRVVLVGAGKVARSLVDRFAEHAGAEGGGGEGGGADIVCVNRTPARALELARRCDGRAVAWNRLSQALRDADAVVVAVRATRPLLTKPVLDRVAARRTSRRRLFVVDASVPRAVERTATVELVNIDAVLEHQHRSLALRRAARPAALRIVTAEVREWTKWRERRPVEDLIRTLYQDAEALSKREAARLTTLSGDEAATALFRVFRQFLHPHVASLRSLAAQRTGKSRTRAPVPDSSN